jgi:hemolysin D
MIAMADRFPNAARHWRVLRESWQAQNLADAAYKERDEYEFLPAALEIIETPASPGLRRLMLITCAMLVLALLWASIGKIDIVAVAAGKTVPAGNVKIIQPIEIGAVRAIHVHNGQTVRKGQLLIELDPTLANASEAQSEQAFASARILQARNNALLSHLDGRPASLQLPAGTPSDIARTEQSLVESAIAAYQAERSSLLQQRTEKQAELVAAQAKVEKLRESLPYLDRQMSARAELAEKGYYSRLRLLEYEQARAEHVRNIDIETANAKRAKAAIGTIDANLQSLRQNFGRTAVTDLSDANDKALLAAEDLRKAARRREFHELRSPVDGVVQQLTVNTVGGVVQAAQPLMVVVPCGHIANGKSCSGGLAVEAFVQNKDIGFVKVGQRVAVKLEAFNFTDYGLIEGTVETISRDAIDRNQQGDAIAQGSDGRPVHSGLVYAARVRLSCSPGNLERAPLCGRLQPGMAVQAEIKTGRRRIIQYIVSPIRKALDEAGRER